MSSSAEKVPFRVIRSKRSTADIVVERDGEVVVRAPDWVDDEQVERIVESKHYWIYKALAEWRDLNATRRVREYKNGEGFLYLGRAYRLSLVEDAEAPVLLKNGRLQVDRSLASKQDAEPAKQALQAYYAERGQAWIDKRVAYFLPKVGVTAQQVDVRDLGNRWASCTSSGRLAFHWKCMMAPAKIIDYIIVHELCHLHHRDHNDAFWNEVDKVLSDYRERKEWLRVNGAAMDL